VRLDQSHLPINTYSDVKIARFQALGHETVTRKSDGAVLSDLRIGYANVTALLTEHNYLSGWIAEIEATDSSLANECAVKALGKLADAKVNLLVTVAEAHKTIDLVLGKANQVYRAISNLRKGRYEAAFKALGMSISDKRNSALIKGWRRRFDPNLAANNFAKQWLELRYGWNPLLMDIKGAAEAILDQLHGGRLPWIVVSAKVTSQKARNVKTASGYSVGSYGIDSATAVKTYKIKIWADLTSPRLNQAQQLGLTNPALVVWELVPFSFVFDWFISVGDYLTAATSIQGITVRRALISRIRELNTSYYSHANSYETISNRCTGYEFKFSSYGRSYNRDPYVVNPLFLYPPVNRDPLNFKRLVTGLALIKSNARGLRV
jgi:hypothetical protein